MDYDYDVDEPYEARILWGRIAAYGVAFLFIFVLGSCFGGRGQVPESEVEQLTAQVIALASENEVLEGRIAARGAAPGPATPTPQPGESPAPDDAGGGDEGGMRTYTVESGDNLYGIAVKMYGDGSKYRLIAEENGLDSSNPLTVGDQLRIPPAD